MSAMVAWGRGGAGNRVSMSPLPSARFSFFARLFSRTSVLGRRRRRRHLHRRCRRHLDLLGAGHGGLLCLRARVRVCVCVRAREARCFGPARSIERLPEQRRGGPPPLVDLLSPFFFFFVSLSFRCQYNNEPAPSPHLRAHAHLKTIKKRNGGGALSTAPPARALAHRFIKREGPHPQFALSPFISPRPRSLPLFPLLTAQTGPPRPSPPP